MCGVCILFIYEIGNVGIFYIYFCIVCEMEGVKGNEDLRGGRSCEG